MILPQERANIQFFLCTQRHLSLLLLGSKWAWRHQKPLLLLALGGDVFWCKKFQSDLHDLWKLSRTFTNEPKEIHFLDNAIIGHGKTAEIEDFWLLTKLKRSWICLDWHFGLSLYCFSSCSYVKCDIWFLKMFEAMNEQAQRMRFKRLWLWTSTCLKTCICLISDLLGSPVTLLKLKNFAISMFANK